MTLIRTCRYLAGVLLAIALCGSFISVIPEKQRHFTVFLAVLQLLAVVAWVSSLILKKQLQENPDSFIFTSQMVSWAAVAIAAIVTGIGLATALG